MQISRQKTRHHTLDKSRDESLTHLLNACQLSMLGNFRIGRNAFPRGIAQVLHGPGLQQRLGSPQLKPSRSLLFYPPCHPHFSPPVPPGSLLASARVSMAEGRRPEKQG